MDFGSLLNQFQQDVKHATSSGTSHRPRSPTNDGEDNDFSSRTSKRRRVDETDASSSFPPVTEIYCLCPAGVQTGGPQALHQLCDQVNRSGKGGVSAYMLYARSDGRNVTHAVRANTPVAYQSYKAPATLEWNALVDSKEDHLFIWPECWTDEMLYYMDYSGGRAQCAIWWLSVNNNTRRFQQWERKDVLHLHQSEYAKQYLKKHGASHVFPMTEYIWQPADDKPEKKGEKNESRPIDVLYNPLKGMHYTDEILKRSGSSMTIRPIGGGANGRQRISPPEVQKLLAQAKIYIDFGPHPGMDRLPREAALEGCVVVTNREGAAYYDEDVPLPARYKRKSFNVDEIHKLLQDVLNNFEERCSDMNEYREWIRGQKERMQDCATSFLDEVTDKRTKNT